MLLRFIRILVVLGLLAILLYAAFYHGLVLKKYAVHTNKLAPGDSIRIVLITDLHSHIYGEEQTGIVSLIKQQTPDLIALAGDIADDVEPIRGTELFMEGIKDLAPVYYVSGNHEYWSNNIHNIKALIRKYGVTVLENDYEYIKVKNSSIIIGGVDDPDMVRFEKPDFDWKAEFHNAFSALQDQPEFKILLAHRPELIEIYKDSNFDLVLSGHAHGGQIRIPLLLNGLFAPNQGWFPAYAGGLYQHGSLTHIVSRGASNNIPLPRIFNPPEVVVIEITAQ
jgi:predicted MPP superfamily phosphohydrolase